MSPLQRGILLRPEDGVSSGDRVTPWLLSTRLRPAVLLGEEPDHGDSVDLKEFIYHPFHTTHASLSQDRTKNIKHW